LTPLATRLMEHTADALSSVRRVFESQAQWNPSVSTREFTIYGSDYALSVIGPVVSRLVSAEAPGVRLRLVPTASASIDDILNRLASLGGLLLPHGVASNRPHLDLWRDDWVVLSDVGNPHVTGELTWETLSELPWVFTYQTRFTFTAVG